MSRYYSNKKCLLSFLVICLSLVACNQSIGLAEDPVDEMPCIELKFTADEISSRTVSGDAKSEFTGAEIKMNSVDIFFYASAASATSVPVHVEHVENKQHPDTHKIVLSETLKNQIFGSGNTCKVYTVVNVNADNQECYEVFDNGVLKKIPKRSLTITDLRNIKATTPTFAGEFDGFAMFTKDADGDVVTYDDTKRSALGTLKVRNLASKIDLFVNFKDHVPGVDPRNSSHSANWDVWQPDSKGDKGESSFSEGTVEVYIVNGTTVVPLGGWTSDDYEAGDVAGYIGSDEYYDLRTDNGRYSRHIRALDADVQEKEGFKYLIEEPIYSYPNQWTTDMLEQHQTYLLMKVNWLPDDFDGDEPVTTALLESYYKIPINLSGDSENKLLSNRYYRVKVNINTLGGMNFGAPLELDDCSWEVLPWGSTQLDADIHEIRWLEIPQQQTDFYDGDVYEAVMNNTTQVTIPYNSTHAIKLKNIRMWYWNFNTSSLTKFEPEEINALVYRENETSGSKLQGLTAYGARENNLIVPAIFTLTDEKLKWFEDNNEEPNGVYIDHENQKITFYHSVYPLTGDNSQGMPGEGESRGVYKKKGDKTYSPYYIELDFVHVDEEEFLKTIRIKQYPGIYITWDFNQGSVGFRASTGNVPLSGTPGTADRGGIYVNGGASRRFGDLDDGSNTTQLGGIGGEGLSDNKNMYSIHVTQLSDDETLLGLKFYDGSARTTRDVKFHVGDPRTKYFNNNLTGDGDLEDKPRKVDDRWTPLFSYPNTKTGAATAGETNRSTYRKQPASSAQGAQRLYPAPVESSDKNTLCYYYPTAEGQGDEQAFMIAPVFRLSSGYADLFKGHSAAYDISSRDLSRENARIRCASFQENGYPAGRWRIPTIGELYFFKMLYHKGVLPDIFGTERAFWSAQYYAKFDFNDANIRTYPTFADVNQHHVRCVYDDWYWVKEDNKTPDIILNNTDKLEFLGPQLNPSYSGTSYSTDGDWREMFVWGDKEKNNPQEQPQD